MTAAMMVMMKKLMMMTAQYQCSAKQKNTQRKMNELTNGKTKARAHLERTVARVSNQMHTDGNAKGVRIFFVTTKYETI